MESKYCPRDVTQYKKVQKQLKWDDKYNSMSVTISTFFFFR